MPLASLGEDEAGVSPCLGTDVAATSTETRSQLSVVG